ncbi:hypothetical protein J7E24_08770 [Hymenobacter sp. ISL-91]|uniref:hypothetical protein n=1 Tax=Hymenobacter sp. ISL-91 TaxID=2819151 RepID=UPI001BEC7D93|nr:hypothetical protein [Hymenobacter sp. ISL-91]MBT2557875.1 hypothetical protein [Hymenobacter sp. ISL-91]
MVAPVNPNGSLLAWLLAGALVLSVGVNLYCLTPEYQSVRQSRTAASHTLGFFDDDDDDEGQDSAWTALHDELRQTRLRLAACQGRATASVAADGAAADSLARR